ncbi:phytanoyl-CoA dioxygenase family protein [Rhodococcus sp. NPDC059968]|uniref:phytanoyl-CoA dioxygenase family protein n=1 Tax=Rhodococcus sp. NPDC059968 TaxID=3347017 RepID=UPI0036721358
MSGGLTTLPCTTTIDEAVEVIFRDGGVIIEDLYSKETISGLREDLEPVLQNVRAGDDEVFAGTQTRRAGSLFARSPHMVDVALSPLYLGISRAILQKPIGVYFGEDNTPITPDIQIGMTQAIQIAPGQGAQPIHRDDTVFLWRHPSFGREARVQIMVAVSDFTKENGGTLVIPGSHLWDDNRKPTITEAVSTEMKAGSGCIFIGSTYHGGGNNSSDDLRTGVTMSFDLSTLRQEENQYLSIPLGTVKGFPAELQRLLGWSAGENFMGWIEMEGQMVDPHGLLERDDYPSALGGLPTT